MSRKEVACILALTISLLSRQTAAATQGVVAGQVLFWNHNGHFCPTTRECDDAYYTDADSENYTGFPRVVVQVQDPDHNVLGASAADEEGNFVVAWYSPTGAASFHLQWQALDYENRVRIEYASGTIVYWSTSNQTLVNGTTPANPQWRDARSGSSYSPNPYANIYWAEWMMWRWSLYYSARMRSYYTNVRILAQSTVCTTSCAEGSTKRIWLDTDPRTPYSPLSRVMHEMGHIASYLSSGSSVGYKETAIYDYNGDSGWTLHSPEWGADQFEEGFATFLAIGGFYGGDSEGPLICGLVNGTACADDIQNDVEYHWHNCDYANEEDRWPLNAIRYLWDVYDRFNTPDDQYSVAWAHRNFQSPFFTWSR